MKVLTVSYRHSQKMTVNYQTCESSIEVQAQVDEGDVVSQVIAALRDRTRKFVRADVERSMSEIMGQAVTHCPVTVPTAAPVPAAILEEATDRKAAG